MKKLRGRRFFALRIARRGQIWYNNLKQTTMKRGGAHGSKTHLPVLHGRAGEPGVGVPALRRGTGRAQPGGQPAGGHAAGRAVYRGRDAEHRRRGHPVPGRGEHRAVPGDHQGVYAPDAVGGAGHGRAAPAQAGQRGAVQDHPDGLCRSLPLHPAHHPRKRSGGCAGRVRGEQHRLRCDGKPRRHPAAAVAG